METTRQLTDTEKALYCEKGQELMRTLNNTIRYNTNDGLDKNYKPNYTYSF